MTVSIQRPLQIDIISCLTQQNLYQRLGLKTNEVSGEELHVSLKKRMASLRNSRHEITAREFELAEDMLFEAYKSLSDPEKRATYDQSLAAGSRWKGAPDSRLTPTGTLIDEPMPEVLKQRSRSTSADLVGKTSATEHQVQAPPVVRVAKSAQAAVPAAIRRNEADPAGVHADRVAADEGTLLMDRYRLGALVNEGRRALIFQAEDLRLQRLVVVKRLRQEYLRSSDSQQLMRSEAERFARCTSGNLVKILDYDLDSGSIIMEKMAMDFTSLKKFKRFESGLAIDVLRDCLTGLEALHSQSIVHGRIDPSHILFDDRGGAKLSVSPGMTGQSGSLLPGPNAQHVAPELLNPAVFGDPGPAADLYSLGFVILEALSGKHFAKRVSTAIKVDSSDPTSWLQWHASPTDHLPPIEGFVKAIPAEFADVLRRMTCKQQQERYLSTTECLQDLKRQQGRLQAAPSVAPSVIEATDDANVDLLGTPDQLHQVYQVPEALTWKRIVQNPSLLFQPEGKRQRMFVLLGSMIAASMLLLLGSGAPPTTVEANNTVDSSNINDEALPDELPLPVDELETNDSLVGDVQIEVEPPAEEVAVQSGSLVSFVVNPTGQVLAVKRIEGGFPDGPEPELRLGNQWSIGPGKYTVAYRDGASGREFNTSIAIPPGENKLIYTIIVPDPPAPQVQPAAPVQREPEAKKPEPFATRYSYAHPSFDFINIPSAKRQQAAEWLNWLLTSTVRDPYKKHTNFDDDGDIRYSSSDPRRSFAFALNAYSRNEVDLAERLCYRSLDEARKHKVPFVLPVQLLSHINIQKSNLGLALANCRDTIRWISERQKESNDAGFKAAMSDLAWWTGAVVGFATESRDPGTLPTVDTEATVSALYDACNPDQFLVFQSSRNRIREQSEKFKAEFADRRLSEEAAENWAEREVRQLKAAKKDEEREQRSVFDLGRFRNTLGNNDPGARRGQEDSSAGLYSSADALEQRYENLGPQPQSPQAYGTVASPLKFTSYQKLDISVLADATRATFPSLAPIDLAIR